MPPASSQSLVQLPWREGRRGQPLETSHPVIEGRCPLFSFPHLQENWAWLVLLLTPASGYGTEAAVLLSCHVSSAQRQGLLLWSTTLTSVLPHCRLSAPLSKVQSPSASHLDPTATTGAIESMAHGMPVVTCVHGNRGQEQTHSHGLSQPLPSVLSSPEMPSTLLCSPERQVGAASRPCRLGGPVWEPVRAAVPGPSSRPG